MKILFSNFPWWQPGPDGLRHGIRAGSRWPFTHHAFHNPNEFRFGGYLPYPFFLGAAASYTAREIEGATVVLRDSIARGESYTPFYQYLREQWFDFIVIESATPSWEHDAAVIREMAAQVPSSRVIITGTLDCAKASDVFKDHANVCAIVQGEYDKQIAAVVREFRANPGAERRVWAHSLLTVEEMNAAPFPMYDPETEGRYYDPCPVRRDGRPVFPQLQAWTSRGCPFKCIFCVWPAVMTGHDPDGTKPRKVRSHSPEWVEAMLRDRIAEGAKVGVNYRTIYLDDDTFNLTEKHTVAICAVMKRIGLPWSAMCRADTVSRETWQIMKDSGCYGVKIGFESGSQHVIDHIVNKRLDIAKAADTARFLVSIGLTVHGTFTVGLPGETAAQQEETRAFIRKLYADGAMHTHQLSGTAEVEGTPLHTLRTTGELTKYDGAKIDDGYIASHDGQHKIEQMRGS